MADLLHPPRMTADFVRLLSTTEGRTKTYRLMQYTSKATQLVLKQVFHHDPNTSEGLRLLKTLETLLGTCRKVVRLFRFLDMWLLLPTVKDHNVLIRRLRQLRIMSFFGMFLCENISLFYPTTKVNVKDENGKQKTLFTIQWGRWCHGFWLVSLCLGLGLDYKLQRSSRLGIVKSLTELPIAAILTLRVRVDDWLMCVLGIISSILGLRNQWAERKAQKTLGHFESAE